MNVYSAQFRAALWWLVPLILLAAMIGWETDWGSAVDKRPPPPDPISPKPVVSSLLPEYAIEGGIAARADTVQRTLFNPTRRPAPPAPQTADAGSMPKGQFALTGTTIVDGKNTAFLRELVSNKSRHVRAGETINGIKVADVQPDRVTLAQGNDSEVLTLKVTTNPRPTPQPVGAPAPAVPVPGQPVAVTNVPGAPPGPPQPQPTTGATGPDSPMGLAERRRAARAAQQEAAAAAAAAGDSGSTPPPPSPPRPAAAAGTQTTWDQVYQGMQNRAATPQNRPSTK